MHHWLPGFGGNFGEWGFGEGCLTRIFLKSRNKPKMKLTCERIRDMANRLGLFRTSLFWCSEAATVIPERDKMSGEGQ